MVLPWMHVALKSDGDRLAKASAVAEALEERTAMLMERPEHESRR